MDTGDWQSMGDEKFVSLTTFRRSGDPVPTAVWVAHDGDGIAVTTPPETGKVKRLRRDPRVEMRPCTRSGKVVDGAPVVTGRAEVLLGDGDVASAHRVLGAKYGLQFKIVMLVERIARRGSVKRAIVRITPA